MPRVGFEEENRGAVVNFDYPKLKLDMGEKARAIVGLEGPLMEWVHTIRKPQIIGGEAVTEIETNERTGVKTKVYKKDFISNPICLGDPAVIAEQGLDPKRCPACKLAHEHPDFGEPPKRRFAMHVVQYKVRPNSFNIATPFSVELVVWGFTDMVYNQLLDAKQEWGDIRQHDFLLGPCTNKMFQKFDIKVGAEAEWLKEDPKVDRRALVLETFKENQIPDLTVAVGRAKTEMKIQMDVNAVLEAWAQISQGRGSRSQATLGDDLNALMAGGGEGGIPQDEWAPPEEDGEFGDLLASSVKADAPDLSLPDNLDDLTAPSAAPAADEPAEESPGQNDSMDEAMALATAPAPTGQTAKEPTDFDDLINALPPAP